MMTDSEGYYRVIEYEEFEKLMKERIKAHERLYLYYRSVYEKADDTTKQVIGEKLREYMEFIVHDKLLLQEARRSKRDSVFLIDELGTPIIVRTGKTVRDEFYERLKEMKKMYV